MSATVPTRLGRVLGAARPLAETVAMMRLLHRLGSDLVTSVAPPPVPVRGAAAPDLVHHPRLHAPGADGLDPVRRDPRPPGRRARPAGRRGLVHRRGQHPGRRTPGLADHHRPDALRRRRLGDLLRHRRPQDPRGARRARGHGHLGDRAADPPPRAVHRHRRRPAQRRGHVLHDHHDAADQHGRDEPLPRLLPRLGRHPRASLRPAALADQGRGVRRSSARSSPPTRA